jgi:hypothetical protein
MNTDQTRRRSVKWTRVEPVYKALREAHGDHVTKDQFATKQHKPHHEAGGARDGKRDFDRKSGTV